MAKDRSEDRHPKGSRHQISMPLPTWERLGEVVGDGNRSDQIRKLVEAFLNGCPMPPLPPPASGASPPVPATSAEPKRAPVQARPVVERPFRPAPKPSQKAKRRPSGH